MSDPIYQDATMAQVRAVDGTFISYPFLEDGDTQTKVYNMVCTQTAADYNAAQVALDTPMSSAANAGVVALPFPADSAAYFVGDTGHTPAGGGMISFTRTFANIPQNVTAPSGSQFVTFPGYEESAALVDGLYTGADASTGLYLTVSQAHGLVVGDPVRVYGVSFNYTNPTESQDRMFIEESDYEVLEIVDSTTFKINPEYGQIKTIYNNIVSALDNDTVFDVFGGSIRVAESSGSISSASVNYSGTGIVITTGTPHGSGEGSDIYINLQYKTNDSDDVQSVNGLFKVTSAPSANTLVIDIGRVFSLSQSITLQPSASFVRVTKNRVAVSLLVPTYTRYSYILPGVTRGYQHESDVVAENPFAVYSNTDGEVVNTCEDLNYVTLENATNIQVLRLGFTIPSATEYSRMVANQANIVIESSLSEWAGNILVLKTKTCKAR